MTVIYFANVDFATVTGYRFTQHFYFSLNKMGSAYVTYVNRTGAKTTLKVAYCGYTYSNRTQLKLGNIFIAIHVKYVTRPTFVEMAVGITDEDPGQKIKCIAGSPL